MIVYFLFVMCNDISCEWAAASSRIFAISLIAISANRFALCVLCRHWYSCALRGTHANVLLYQLIFGCETESNQWLWSCFWVKPDYYVIIIDLKGYKSHVFCRWWCWWRRYDAVAIFFFFCLFAFRIRSDRVVV